jgi:hypothetical protein
MNISTVVAPVNESTPAKTATTVTVIISVRMLNWIDGRGACAVEVRGGGAGAGGGSGVLGLDMGD